LPERSTISNGWDEEEKKLRALSRVGAGMALLLLVLLVIMFSMHGLH